MTWGDLHHPLLLLLESFKMLVEALASSECFFFFFLILDDFSNLVINNVEVIILITSPTAYFVSVCVRVHVCCSTKGCMTVKGWLKMFCFFCFVFLKVVSLALLSLLRCFLSPFGVLPPFGFSSCIIVSLSFYLLNVSCCLFSAL